MNLLLRRDGVLLCLGSKCSIVVYSGVRSSVSKRIQIMFPRLDLTLISSIGI